MIESNAIYDMKIPFAQVIDNLSSQEAGEERRVDATGPVLLSFLIRTPYFRLNFD